MDAATIYQAGPAQTTTKNGYKCIENLTLEGTFKLKKVYFSRNQIPIERHDDDFYYVSQFDKKQEAIP